MKKLLLLVICFCIYCHSEDKDEITLKKRPFYSSLIETGEIQAFRSQMFLMPQLGWQFGEPKIVYLVEDGRTVFPGDTILIIDSSGIIRFIKEKENELKISRTEYNKLLLEQEITLENLKNDMLKAESQFEQAKLNLKKIKFESPNQKKISKLNFESSKLQYEQKQRGIQCKKIELKNNIKIKKLKISQQKNMLKKAELALKKIVITTESKGMAVLQKNRATRQKVMIGDATWPGSPVVGLPNMDRVKAITSIHEKDHSRLKTNQKVIIRLDAFPDKAFEGTVQSIAKLPYKKNRDDLYSFFEIQISIDESNPILKPGMTVSCEIITSDHPSVFTIPHSFIREENSTRYLLDENNNRIPVEIVDKNKTHCYIKGNLKEGIKVINNRKED